MALPAIFLIFQFRFLDILDILLVAFLLFELYNLIKGTNAMRIFLGIIAIYLLWKIVNLLEMKLLGEILGAFISVGFLALIVVFQPEIRKFLLLLGTPGIINSSKRGSFFRKLNLYQSPSISIHTLVSVTFRMASSKTGALIVICRQNELPEIIQTGEILNATLSEALIETIFFKNNPLHDGAVVINRNEVTAARCILPVSSNSNLPADLGLRHRAALGITEQSDAIAIVVSEENGKVSYAVNRKINTGLSQEELSESLKKDLLL